MEEQRPQMDMMGYEISKIRKVMKDTEVKICKIHKCTGSKCGSQCHQNDEKWMVFAAVLHRGGQRQDNETPKKRTEV